MISERLIRGKSRRGDVGERSEFWRRGTSETYQDLLSSAAAALLVLFTAVAEAVDAEVVVAVAASVVEVEVEVLSELPVSWPLELQ